MNTDMPLLSRIGRGIALLGVALPLLLIGHSKFSAFEVEALKPLIAETPWLAWMLPAFGEVTTSRILGVVEIAAALLLLLAPWVAAAGIAGGALAAGTFLVTISTMFVLPIWAEGAGGIPALNGAGAFLIKDIALLGISLVILAESVIRVRTSR